MTGANSATPPTAFDVAIIGGGLAGNLLVRQLRAEVPKASVVMVEKAEDTSFKVGESTVEIATDYLIRRQNLSTYLYENHLPKNGLRFFFDNEARNAPIETMSELGTDSLPKIPSFQLDRQRLERDLRRMNADTGATVWSGTAVRELALSEDGGNHTFKAVSDSGSTDVQARWVIDCSGRAGVVNKKKKIHVPVERHQIMASWGRFTGVGDIDQAGTLEWRDRFRHTSRHLSTNHFCYPGYWIWFIPLRNGVVSVGVVGERSVLEAHRGESGFVEFLKSHGAVWDLLKSAELVDFMGFKQLAFGTKTFFSPDRWAAVGDAAAFVDPFYSPGSDFIAVENDYVCDLIRRDMDGERGDDFERRRATYDAFVKHRFDATMLLYEDQYRFFGSFELMRPKLLFDISGYYNQWLRPYMLDEHLDVDKVSAMVDSADTVLAIMRQYRKLFQRVYDHLQKTGNYYRLNTGDAGAFAPLMPFADEMGRAVPMDRVDQHTAWIFGSVRSWCRQILKEDAAKSCEELAALL